VSNDDTSLRRGAHKLITSAKLSFGRFVPRRYGQLCRRIVVKCHAANAAYSLAAVRDVRYMHLQGSRRARFTVSKLLHRQAKHAGVHLSRGRQSRDGEMRARSRLAISRDDEGDDDDESYIVAVHPRRYYAITARSNVTYLSLRQRIISPRTVAARERVYSDDVYPFILTSARRPVPSARSGAVNTIA